MTPSPKPLDREGWEKLLMDFGRLCISFGGPISSYFADKYAMELASSRDSILNSILALQSKVERLKAVLEFYANDDTYHIEILGACGLSDDMDEWGQFGKKAKEALEAIDNARQPK